MKTAMQELIDWIESTQFPKEGSGNYIYEKAKKLLKIEKEQMFDFFLKGYSIGESDFNPKSEANKYYNQTYKEEIQKL
jgi:hypothetical protein